MAFELTDRHAGFFHTEVAHFINREVLLNGGSPDFYLSNRNLTWNGVEDKLQMLLKDPNMPGAKKRAYVWSALALSVRFGARQAQRHNERVQTLWRQLNEAQTTASSAAGNLQTMRGDFYVSSVQFHRYRDHLQQALIQTERVRERLRQAEMLAQASRMALKRAPPMPIQQPPPTTGPLLSKTQNHVTATDQPAEQNMTSQIATDVKATSLPRQRNIWANDPSTSLPLHFSMPSHNQAAPRYEPHDLNWPPFDLGLVSEAAAAIMFPPRMPSRSLSLSGISPKLGTQENIVQPCQQSTSSQENTAPLPNQSIQTEDECAGAKEDKIDDKGWCLENPLQQGLQIKTPKCMEGKIAP